jgi:putative transposase
MARIARVVAAGMPHHVVQRGNRRQDVFFSDEDKRNYLKILKEQSELHGVEYWAYCLMDNHVHLIAVPQGPESLAKAIGETHRRYTRMINFREGWRGYLWQGRFHSFVLGERHLYAAMRYVERNPVRAKMVSRAEEYSWSSARAHAFKKHDEIITNCFLEDEIKDWSGYLDCEEGEEDLKLMRRHGATGRPLGSGEFIKNLARKLGVDLEKKRPGRKPKRSATA